MNIEIIPRGKENGKTKQELMREAKINDEQFKKELAELKKENIIICEDLKYYIPNTKEEYLKFIEKYNKQSYNTARIINLAYEKLKEMEE